MDREGRRDNKAIVKNSDQEKQYKIARGRAAAAGNVGTKTRPEASRRGMDKESEQQDAQRQTEPKESELN